MRGFARRTSCIYLPDRQGGTAPCSGDPHAPPRPDRRAALADPPHGVLVLPRRVRRAAAVRDDDRRRAGAGRRGARLRRPRRAHLGCRRYWRRRGGADPRGSGRPVRSVAGARSDGPGQRHPPRPVPGRRGLSRDGRPRAGHRGGDRCDGAADCRDVAKPCHGAHRCAHRARSTRADVLARDGLRVGGRRDGLRHRPVRRRSARGRHRPLGRRSPRPPRSASSSSRPSPFTRPVVSCRWPPHAGRWRPPASSCDRACSCSWWPSSASAPSSAPP